VLKKILTGLVDIIYPPRCLICHEKLKIDSLYKVVCIQCWSKIKRNSPPFCRRCGRHLKDPSKDICGLCQDKNYYFDRAFSACIYEGVLKELIHQFKYSDKEYLGNILSELLIDFIKQYNIPLEAFDFLIPVPLHKRKLREREFNQAEILAQSLACAFNLVLSKDALLRIRDTATQTELKENERLKNVEGCFMVNPGVELKGKDILLIDDLLTTGATCSQAAYALKKAGCNQVIVMTLAN
jgi:ComF family protein